MLPSRSFNFFRPGVIFAAFDLRSFLTTATSHAKAIYNHWPRPDSIGTLPATSPGRKKGNGVRPSKRRRCDQSQVSWPLFSKSLCTDAGVQSAKSLRVLLSIPLAPREKMLASTTNLLNVWEESLYLRVVLVERCKMMIKQSRSTISDAVFSQLCCPSSSQFSGYKYHLHYRG